MIIFNTKQAKGLLNIHDYLVHNKNTMEIENHLIDKLLVEIIEALKEGCYTTETQRKLNEARNIWLLSQPWTCSYCLKSTKEIEYDYLSGYDHLECVLKE